MLLGLCLLFNIKFITPFKVKKKGKNIMTSADKFQLCEVKNQQLDHIRRDASSSKKREIGDFWKHQCQLSERQQQSKGKELALPEGKDPFNGVAIGEDGKPIERQIILSNCYDKDHPGLPGGGRIGKAVKFIATMMLDNAVYLGYDQLLEMIKEDAVEEKLDKMIRSRFETGAALLEDAKRMENHELKQQTLLNAAKKFISASKVESDGLMQAKAMFYTGECYNLLDEQNVAMGWHQEAAKKFISESMVGSDGLRQAEAMFYTGMCYNSPGERNTATEWHQKAYDKAYSLGENAINEIERVRVNLRVMSNSDSYILSQSYRMDQNRETKLMDQLNKIHEFLASLRELPSTSDNPRRDLRRPKEGHELVPANSDSCAIL